MRFVPFGLLLLGSLAVGCTKVDPYTCEDSSDCRAGYCGADKFCHAGDDPDADAGPDATDAFVGGRDECMEGPRLAANASACAASVCAVEADCCAVGWTHTCVQRVETLCERSCSAVALLSHAGGVTGVNADGSTAIPVDLRGFNGFMATATDHDGDGDVALVYVGADFWAIRDRDRSGQWVDVGRGTLDRWYGRHIGWADWDGDGDLDLAVGGRSGGMYLIRRDAGVDGGKDQFVRLASPLLDDDVLQFDWGDVDGDRDVDLVVGTYPLGQIRLHINDGHGVFSVSSPGRPTFQASEGVRLCNLTGSALPELVTSHGTAVRIYANNNGSFSTTPLLAADGVESIETHCGDFDRDGDLDVVVAGLDTPIRIFRNDGGTFAITAAWASPNVFAWGLDVGDIDGDHLPDLAVSQPFGAPLWYRNTTASPTAPVTFAGSEVLVDPDAGERHGIDLIPAL